MLQCVFAMVLDSVTRTLRTKSPEPIPKQVVEIDEDGNFCYTDVLIDVWKVDVLPIL